MRVVRVILWRSLTIRYLTALVTGLAFEPLVQTADPASGPQSATASLIATQKSATARMLRLSRAATKNEQSAYHTNVGIGLGLDVKGLGGKTKTAGVKFTFIIYENQRRWMLLGWTPNLFTYERSAWTDEHLNQVTSLADFELPDVEGGSGMRWRWVSGTHWRVDGVPGGDTEEVDYDSDAARMGWVYYDTKWQNGRRGVDGWARWTRRRKWYRDAELVDEVASIPAIEIQTGALKDENAMASNPTEPVGVLPSHSQEASETHTSPHDQTSSPSLSGRPRSARPRRDRDKDRNGSENDHAAGKPSDDSASLLSTSSRSIFKPSSLLKRTPAITSTTSVGFSAVPISSSSRNRRDGPATRPAADLKLEALLDDEAAALGLEVALEMQGRGREARQWGMGDDVKMGLE